MYLFKFVVSTKCFCAGKQPKAEAKSKTLKQKMAALKQLNIEDRDPQDQEEGEEEEVREHDPEVEARDYGKARKFAKLYKSGGLPDDLKELYEKAANQQVSPRLFRTQLINKMFTKNAKGEYVLCTKDPTFENWRKNHDKSWKGEESKGQPWSIILWQVFQGNEQALKDAIEVGDVYEVDGYYHHNQRSSGRRKETEQGMELHGGKTKLETESFAELSNFLAQRDWSKFGKSLELSTESTQQPAKRPRQQLALQNGPAASNPSSSARPSPAEVKIAWKALEATTNDAKSATERLQREGFRWVAKVRGQDESLQNRIKSVMEVLADNLNHLQSCQMWQEVPGTEGNKKNLVEEFFHNIAERTEKANEGLEEIKAVCKARGLWGIGL